MMHSDDKTMWCRHELKHLVSEAQALAITRYIAPLVSPDRHPAGGSYRIVSLYLDSPDLLLCRQSLEGVKNRFKLRIRSYAEELSDPCFCEIKRRVNDVISKTRAVVSPRTLGELVSPVVARELRSADACGALEQFLYYRRLIGARPTLFVRYQRQAFEGSAPNRVRITLDRDLEYATPHERRLCVTGSPWRPIHREGVVVLEIKFTGFYPAWVSRLAGMFNLWRQSISKYALLLRWAANDALCRPDVVWRNGRGATVVPA
jgi:hypothetical protein